jgi:hypothetical protein
VSSTTASMATDSAAKTSQIAQLPIAAIVLPRLAGLAFFDHDHGHDEQRGDDDRPTEAAFHACGALHRRPIRRP